MADIGKIEYRVKKTDRYIVTRYHEDAAGTFGGVETKGEYENGEVAFEVAYALCRAEHERFGFPPGDMRIQYPEYPEIKGVANMNSPRVAGSLGG